MKPGQKIKVATNDDSYWQEAKLLSIDEQRICEVEFGEPGLVGHRIEKRCIMGVREFRPLEYIDGECPALNQMAERDMPLLIEALTNVLACLLPNEKFTVENGIIYAYNHTISMEPTVVETRTIGAFVEYPGWSVTVWRNHPATRNEPADVSDSPIGNFVHYGQAVQKFVETLFLLKSEDYWDNQADLAMVAQWEQTHDMYIE